MKLSDMREFVGDNTKLLRKLLRVEEKIPSQKLYDLFHNLPFQGYVIHLY